MLSNHNVVRRSRQLFQDSRHLHVVCQCDGVQLGLLLYSHYFSWPTSIKVDRQFQGSFAVSLLKEHRYFLIINYWSYGLLFQTPQTEDPNNEHGGGISEPFADLQKHKHTAPRNAVGLVKRFSWITGSFQNFDPFKGNG